MRFSLEKFSQNRRLDILSVKFNKTFTSLIYILATALESGNKRHTCKCFTD